MTSLHLPRVLLLTSIGTWVALFLATVLIAHHSRLQLGTWAVASALFIVSFVWNARRGTISRIALGVQSASVITMVALLCNGYEGLLLVLVAAQLALRVDTRPGLAWIAAHTLALGVSLWLHWDARSAFLLTPPYLGFQVLVFAAVRLLVDEQRARRNLTESNDALLRLQDERAQNARLEERLRITQDMHDVLGHHLTALSLNLELASHESQGAARATIRSAQSLARALLADVKALVRSADDEVPVDLQQKIKQLAHELPRPKLHITCPSDLAIADARTSRTLFRVIQEVVTNAIRHGDARNVWITIERTADLLRLVARDDGEVGDQSVDGFGLVGMRRRLEALGGTLSAAPAMCGGFEVRAELPNTRDSAS